ncbi:hypothetical protein Tco_1323944 [Tanacetum coccineum]
MDDRSVKLIDITLEKWLDLKFGDHKKVEKEIMEEVVNAWLIRSYRKQFEEYMEIKRRLELDGINTYIRGDDEEVLTNDELSDLEEEKVSEEKEVAKISRIETDIFDFETPLYLPGFKTYEDYKNAWIDEWNKEVLWVEEKPCGHVQWPTCNSSEEGYCNGENLPGMIRVGNMNYFQNYKWYEGLEDGNLKNEALKEKAILEGSWDMKIEREIKFSHG